jgi:hypothetical protein
MSDEVETARRKPEILEFRCEGKTLHASDPATGTDYRVYWCGNGQYSHYGLDETGSPGVGWYVYVNDKDPLYRAIRDAEMRLIYKAVPCEKCRTNYVSPEHRLCYRCNRLTTLATQVSAKRDAADDTNRLRAEVERLTAERDILASAIADAYRLPGESAAGLDRPETV